MIPMATWKDPKKGKKDMWKKCQHQENMTTESWGGGNESRLPHLMDKIRWENKKTN